MRLQENASSPTCLAWINSDQHLRKVLARGRLNESGRCAYQVLRNFDGSHARQCPYECVLRYGAGPFWPGHYQPARLIRRTLMLDKYGKRVVPATTDSDAVNGEPQLSF